MEDVNIFGGYFESPLIAALGGDHPNIVKLLLDRGIEVNHPSLEHGLPLHCAYRRGNKKLANSLLDRGADINAYDMHGSVLAAVAFPKGDLRRQRAIVEELLRHKPKVQIRNSDLLTAATQMYSKDRQYFVSLFLEHDMPTVVVEETIVKVLGSYNPHERRGETLSLLLRHDGGRGTTPAMLKAAECAKAMNILLNHELVCQVTEDVLEHVIKVRSTEKVELIKLPLAHDPKISITGTTIVAAMRQKAQWHSDTSVLKLLLDYDPDFEITDEILEAVQESDVMAMVLPRRYKEQAISPRVLEKAAEQSSEGATLISQLLRHDQPIKITPPVISAAIILPPVTISPLPFHQVVLDAEPKRRDSLEDSAGA